jgi:hypothetical protein
MTNLTDTELARVTGGAGTTNPLVCTPANPSGVPKQPAPTQFLENSHAGPSMNDRIMNATNTLTSRGMSMLNDGRPSMPDQW